MALNSINTNVAAMNAQSNIGRASTMAGSSIARLSSGNRIVRAADDVAAMSAGTSLRTQVTTLKMALTNTAQGSSLLQVADGALSQITDILQRQKALTVQAGSGSLTSSERSFLNQEFQNLSQEIDRLVGNTNFNGVTLLNGSLSKATSFSTNADDVTTATQTTAFVGNYITIADAAFANGEFINVNGVRVEFVDAAAGTAAAEGKVATLDSAGAALTVNQIAQNVAAFLNNSNDARLANLSFAADLNAATIDVTYSGGALANNLDIAVTDESDVGTDNITLAAAQLTFTAAATIEDGLGATSFKVTGNLETANLLTANGVQLASDTGANDATGVRNNEAFIGDVLSQMEVRNVPGTADALVFRLQVGEVTYISDPVTIAAGADIEVVLTGQNTNTGVAEGGDFRIVLQDGAITPPGADFSEEEVADIQSELRKELGGLTVLQNRNIRSFNPDGITVDNSNGVQVANLSDLRANFIGSNFTGLEIEEIKVIEAQPGTTDATIEVRINGETYRSYQGLGTQIAVDTLVSLQNVNDPTKSFSFLTGNTGIAADANIALDISSKDNATAIQAALEDAFGIADGKAKVQFQTGATVSDSIGIEIKSVETQVIYDRKDLNVLTVEASQEAGTQIDIAIDMVTSVRAEVGALQSRFDFAAANVESSISNQDAARGVLLDTDIAAESTAFATAQVQLQAGISVLAQANLLPQNLLKLIG